MAMIGLSLASSIIELNDSLRLFTQQSKMALGVKCDLVYLVGWMSARYSYASLSNSFISCILFSNSLTVVVAAHLHNAAFNSKPLKFNLKLL